MKSIYGNSSPKSEASSTPTCEIGRDFFMSARNRFSAELAFCTGKSMVTVLQREFLVNWRNLHDCVLMWFCHHKRHALDFLHWSFNVYLPPHLSICRNSISIQHFFSESAGNPHHQCCAPIENGICHLSHTIQEYLKIGFLVFSI